MASFTVTLDTEPFDVDGKFRAVRGSYLSAGGATGGDIVTGLNQVWEMILEPTGASVQANAPVVNETFPVQGGTVTIVTDADVGGRFRAVGR